MNYQSKLLWLSGFFFGIGFWLFVFTTDTLVTGLTEGWPHTIPSQTVPFTTSLFVSGAAISCMVAAVLLGWYSRTSISELPAAE